MQRRPGANAIGLSAAALILASASHAQAQSSAHSQPSSEVEELVVYGREVDLVGVAQSGSQGVVGYKDFENRPLARVGELVENVPGLIATQHSGTGKANQYFMRGFNLDHGTDLAGFVDGAPVNMRSHGHGQGYLDFNFLIPELIERIDYRKGPYFSDVGDFSAAGTVRFTTVDDLRAPIAELTAGSFGYYRGLLAGSRYIADGSLLFGLEAVVSDGPWVLDEDLSKLNGLFKYSRETSEGSWSVALSGYLADWTATDQVPERALTSGQISRFGFIDPDLGGRSSRSQVTGHWTHGGTTLHAYAITSDLRLTSNFTYLLDDPVNGDEFQQRDHRGVFGGDLRHTLVGRIANKAATFRFGGDVRYDAIGNVGLYRSSNANPTAVVRQDEVNEYSVGLYGEAEIKLTDRLRAVIGLRGDAFGYDVASDLAANSGDGTDALIAPKVALAWQISDRLEAYANYGESFHSNDARGATITIDPVTGDPADAVDLLSRAQGSELGLRWGGEKLTVTAVVYHLNLASELVYVGDAGTTEPNDATERYGLEFSSFWRPTDWLTFDAAATFTHARFSGVAAGLDRIPGSIGTVVALGASAELGEGLNATVRVRHFGEAPLIEDGSRRSDATTQVNLGVYYTVGNTRLGLDVLNLFDSEDADITYFYASRLQGEPVDGVEDRHIHPVEPFQVRISLRQGF